MSEDHVDYSEAKHVDTEELRARLHDLTDRSLPGISTGDYTPGRGVGIPVDRLRDEQAEIFASDLARRLPPDCVEVSVDFPLEVVAGESAADFWARDSLCIARYRTAGGEPVHLEARGPGWVGAYQALLDREQLRG